MTRAFINRGFQARIFQGTLKINLICHAGQEAGMTKGEIKKGSGEPLWKQFNLLWLGG